MYFYDFELKFLTQHLRKEMPFKYFEYSISIEI